MRAAGLSLSPVLLEESLVKDVMNSAMRLYTANTIGPEKYLNLYKKYADLVNGKEQDGINRFFAEKHALDVFKEVNIRFTLSSKLKGLSIQLLILFCTQTMLFHCQHLSRLSPGSELFEVLRCQIGVETMFWSVCFDNWTVEYFICLKLKLTINV